MAIHQEIERKFLVGGEFRHLAVGSSRLTQGYICVSKEATVRVRIDGDLAMLTIKGESSADGLSRAEWEHWIGIDEARDLLGLCQGGVIDKVRYQIPYGVHTITVDEFLGDNAGLILAEVEFESLDVSFDKPDWLSDEVTGDIRYYNSYLSTHPYNRQ